MPEMTYIASQSAQTAALAATTSKSVKLAQQQMASLRAELEASGMLKPATIINFNPVPLALDGLMRITVPAAGSSEAGRKDFEFNGQLYRGHLLTIRTPLFYLSTQGHIVEPMGDMPQVQPHHVLPIGQAYAFLEHYSLSAPDSPHMGGVLIFEGDQHALDERHLLQSEGNILIPEPVRLPLNKRTYRTVPRPLVEVAADIFTQQANYALARMEYANSLWTTNDPNQQKHIQEVDRRWARFALEHQLIEVLPEWSYKSAASGASMLDTVRCPVCGAPKPSSSLYLCPKDGAPYNTVEAFLAGQPVAQHFLDVLDGEALDIVAREQVARENRRKSALARARKEAAAE